MAIAIDARTSIYFRKKRGPWDLAYYFPVATFTKWADPDIFGKQKIAYTRKCIQPQWNEMWQDFKRGFILRPGFAVASSSLLLAILIANHRLSQHEAPLAMGAIAFDAHTSSTETNATTKTTNHTASGSNSFVVADTFLDGTNADQLTGLTWNSNNMTVIDKIGRDTPTGYCYSYYYANGTADGNSHACTATYSASHNHGLDVTSYTGVSQSSPIDSHANFSQTSEGSPHNFSTTVVATGCWLHAYLFVFNGGESAGTGTTQRSNPDSNRFILDSNGTVNTGSQSLQLTGVTESYAGVIFSFAKGSNSTTLSLSETPGIIERFSRLWTAPRDQNELIGLQSESLSRAWNAPRSPKDNITITETISGIKARILDILENLGINESLSRTVFWVRTFNESPTITEIFSRAWTRVISALESITIRETISINKVLTLIISEIVLITEYLRTPLNWLKRTKPSTLWTPRTKP